MSFSAAWSRSPFTVLRHVVSSPTGLLGRTGGAPCAGVNPTGARARGCWPRRSRRGEKRATALGQGSTGARWPPRECRSRTRRRETTSSLPLAFAAGAALPPDLVFFLAHFPRRLCLSGAAFETFACTLHGRVTLPRRPSPPTCREVGDNSSRVGGGSCAIRFAVTAMNTCQSRLHTSTYSDPNQLTRWTQQVQRVALSLPSGIMRNDVAELSVGFVIFRSAAGKK